MKLAKSRMMQQLKNVEKKVVVFTSKYPLIGPIFWILAVQYLMVQVIVAAAWTTSHSWKDNYISDLGNTACGSYDGLYVCSPLHSFMNGSFALFGVTMALGALLIYTEFKRTTWSLIGFVLMSLAGFGTILVGLFPENTINELHQIGAFLGLVVGNVSILVLAFALSDVRRSFRVYSITSAAVSLTAFVLFVSEVYLGIGRGGMERLVSYPFTIWMILFGIYMTAVRMRARRHA